MLIGTLVIVPMLVHGTFYSFLPIYLASDREMAPNAMICSGFCIIGQSLKWRQLGKVGKCQGRETMGHENVS